MNDHHAAQPRVNWTHVVIGLLVAALLAVLVWFALDIRSLYRSGVVAPAISRIHRRFLNQPAPVASQVQGWMTFRYVQYVFSLPPGYLATKLGIGDSSYLNMTIDGYANKYNMNEATFVQSARDAVAGYQNSTTP
jgi:hypothetical protein